MNALDQFGCAANTYSSQHCPRHLAELIFDQVQPGAVCWGEHKNEPLRHGLQVTARLLGDMRRMVVQDQPDLLLFRIRAVQLFEKGDEVAAVVRLADGLDDLPTVQI